MPGQQPIFKKGSKQRGDGRVNEDSPLLHLAMGTSSTDRHLAYIIHEAETVEIIRGKEVS